MLDKNPNPIDPSWADEGWQRMQQMLDQEMPITADPNSRKAAAWQVALLGLLLAAAVACLMLYAPVASQAVSDLRAFPIPLADSKQAAIANTAKPAKSKGSGHQPTASVARQPVKNQPRPGNTSLTAGRKQAALLPIEGKAISRVNRSTSEKTATPSPQLILKKLPVKPAKIRQTAPQDIQNQPSATTTPNVRYGLRLGAALAGFQSPDGYTAEITSAFRLGTQSPFYARAGLGYWLWRQWEVEGERTLLFTNTNFFQAAQSNSGTQTLKAVHGTEELHYATASLELGYQLHPRWSVETGLQYAHRVGSRSAVRWTTQSEQVTESTPSDSSEPDALSAVAEHLRHDRHASNSRTALFSGKIGLRYRIGPQLSAGLHWQQSLQPLFQSPASAQHRKFALCSVTYWVR